ncbi:hypothetical protein AKJ16_DCAP08999 [Drosera capensis]
MAISSTIHLPTYSLPSSFISRHPTRLLASPFSLTVKQPRIRASASLDYSAVAASNKNSIAVKGSHWEWKFGDNSVSV